MNGRGVDTVSSTCAARLAESCGTSVCVASCFSARPRCTVMRARVARFAIPIRRCPPPSTPCPSWEGEQPVRHASVGSDVHVTIVRSPLVYGPEVKANFLSLLKLVDSGLPLPLANIRSVGLHAGTDQAACERAWEIGPSIRGSAPTARGAGPAHRSIAHGGAACVFLRGRWHTRTSPSLLVAAIDSVRRTL
jgi:hypothetical protein